MKPSIIVALLAAVLIPAVALAGMPAYFLSDAADARIEAISFFLLVLLLASVGVHRLWNGLARELERVPHLSFRGALALTCLLALAFYLMLVMVSGARELMTPGAWEKNGATYRLTSERSEPHPDRRGER